MPLEHLADTLNLRSYQRTIRPSFLSANTTELKSHHNLYPYCSSIWRIFKGFFTYSLKISFSILLTNQTEKEACVPLTSFISAIQTRDSRADYYWRRVQTIGKAHTCRARQQSNIQALKYTVIIYYYSHLYPDAHTDQFGETVSAALIWGALLLCSVCLCVES